MVMTHALVNFSPWLRIFSWLEFRGKRIVSLCSSGKGGTNGKHLPVRTCMCGAAHDCGCVVDGSNAMVAL